MNRTLLAGLVSAVLVAGCAPVQYTKSDVDGMIVCNTDEMDRIDRDAIRRYASVYWVNCPRATLRVI
jgi:hypothetical protein